MGIRLANHPNIQENRDKAKNSESFRVFLHGVNLSLNFETHLNTSCDATQKYIVVNDSGSNYVSYTGFICLQDEIMYVNSASVVDSETTRFEVVRARYGTVALTHDIYEYIRSVIEVTQDTTGYKTSMTMCNPLSDLFSPVISNGYLYMSVLEPYDWAIWSTNRKYNTANKTVLYIYEGIRGEIMLQYTGFNGICTFDTDMNKVEFKFEDKLGLWWEKKMDKDLIFKDDNIKTVLSELLDYDINKIQYSTFDYGTSGILVDGSFYNCDLIGTNEVEKYRDFLKLLSTLGIRMCFDQYENLLLFSDININT